MKKLRVQKSHLSSASPEQIYPLVANSATYPYWSMVDRYEMGKPGRDAPHGVGEQRLFQTGRLVVREEVVELLPNRVAAYVLLSGFPLNEYRGETLLELSPGGGTKITWRCSFYPKHPGTGWLWQLFMSNVFRRFVRDLARAAENPARRDAILAAAQGHSSAKPARQKSKEDGLRCLTDTCA